MQYVTPCIAFNFNTASVRSQNQRSHYTTPEEPSHMAVAQAWLQKLSAINGYAPHESGRVQALHHIFPSWSSN